MESAIDKLLKNAQLQDDSKPKDKPPANLTMEEVATWHAKLRHDRELMFRSETKLKRMAKIKSKTYRKIQRRRREADKLSLEQIESLDPEAAETERMKMEAERAKERVTLRHRNTGKWARQLASRGEDLDRDQRKQLMEQLERGEQLRKKIQDTKGDDEESASEDEEDEGGVEAIRAKAFDELRALEGQEPASAMTSLGKKSGLMQMKFMREAEERVETTLKAQVDDFRTEMLRLGSEIDEVEKSLEVGELPEDPKPSALEKVSGNVGRMVFRPTAPWVGLSAVVIRSLASVDSHYSLDPKYRAVKSI